MRNRWTMMAVAGTGLALALVVTGCGASSDVVARGVEASGPQAPFGNVTVACEPGQRVIAEQVVVAGTPTARFACVDDVSMVSAPTRAMARPAVYERVVEPVASPRVISTRPVEPARAPARASRDRSWQKSAVIIGSTAGIGAGVGAATGGKKGALIGAAIGGGGAAIWDQATRRR
ncbi:MAG: hypothetical protein KJ066_20460 [Acidobacteria bacterium]|nr:hypothetical protein [Acidobacteriota bacterium]